ncbi:hypothetical protein P170DRAFT_510411 [Aspergillus steynii IBT 23096]|uniref:Uncharacterized protein n=1 Tax=Aspergillus steynii IBT 23096 TaxID=1392250 RepID=A0A2I2G3Z0_9EURO|nr:uncharacterized protein P170DRAFT_510411 [Aspergillus steynii IBT 23096]PLB47596.1 hypothetical protein P170DRAFT_510411 [Aspergillus steynii IBT 23096]
MEHRKIPKDPSVARVFTIGTGPSEQYNALVPSDPLKDWEDWYLWCPLPMGSYYAADLLKMMLVVMDTDLCVLVNQKVNKMPQYNSGIYWIMDLTKRDWRDGLPGIMNRARSEIEEVLKKERFPADEKVRIQEEVEDGFQDWMRERSQKGLYTGPGNSSASDSESSAPPLPRRSSNRPSRAIPIIDPRTVQKDSSKDGESSESAKDSKPVAESSKAASSKADGSSATKGPDKKTEKGSSASQPKAAQGVPPRRPSKAIPIVNPADVPDKAPQASAHTAVTSTPRHALPPRPPPPIRDAYSGNPHGAARVGVAPVPPNAVHIPPVTITPPPGPGTARRFPIGPPAVNMGPQRGLHPPPAPGIPPGGFPYGASSPFNRAMPRTANPYPNPPIVTPGGPVPTPHGNSHLRQMRPPVHGPPYGPQRTPFPCLSPRTHSIAPRVNHMPLRSRGYVPSPLGHGAHRVTTPQGRGVDRAIPEGTPTGPRSNIPSRAPGTTASRTETPTPQTEEGDKTDPQETPTGSRDQSHDNTPPPDAPTGPRNPDAPIIYPVVQNCGCNTASLGDYIDASQAKADAKKAHKCQKKAEKKDDKNPGSSKEDE